jgi:hypothetical protein
MMNNKPIIKSKILSGLLKAMIRIAIMFVYVCSLFIFGAGYYKYIAHQESQKTLERYTDENMPTHAAVLLYKPKDGQKSDVILGSINISDDMDPEWKLYQTPGGGEVPVGDDYDSCHYGIKAISDTRTRIKLSYWMGGGDRKSVYVYEIENNRVYPRFYNELADYFGWMFSALPLAFISTFIFIAIFELLVVRRYIFKSEGKWGRAVVSN